MTETPERDREIAAGAIGELLRKHKAAGNSMSAMLGAMADIADQGLERLLGSERMSHLHRNKADSAALRATRPALNLADPGPGDARVYVARALDDAPAALDRDSVYCGAIIHAALSLAARRGADGAMYVLGDLFKHIKEGTAERTFRTGDPSKDMN